MAHMPSNPRPERLRRAGAERSQSAISARLVEERYRAESDALRRANIVESGSEAERAALREEHRQQAARGHEMLVRARAERGDFLAALEIAMDFRTRWTSGEAPADVVWQRPSDGR